MSIASDIKRKRKQREAEIKRAKAKRIDLSKWPIHLRAGNRYVDHLTACDLFLTDDMVWRAEQLVWLPDRFQCRACRTVLVRNHPGHGAPDVDYETCDTHSATPLMLTTIEIVLHAFAAFCVAWGEAPP